MFFGMCIYETLGADGRLDSIIIMPAKDSSVLVTDRLADVGPKLTRDVDIGPLRFYANESELSVRTAASVLAPPAFRESAGELTLDIQHLHWPLRQSHAGYYILLLPAGFGGDVEVRPGHSETIFMTDTHQILLAATVVPDRSSLSVRARLRRGAAAPSRARASTAQEVFRTSLPGVHYTPVDNLLRAMRQNLSTATASAFLCHSSANKKDARRLAIELATRGVRPWIDEAEIRTGDSLIDKIQSGISSTTCLVPVLSKAAVASRWCKEELRMALAMQIKSGIKGVLPVLLEDCDIPGFLLEKAYADLREWQTYDETVDRLAADIRDLGNDAGGKSAPESHKQ